MCVCRVLASVRAGGEEEPSFSSSRFCFHVGGALKVHTALIALKKCWHNSEWGNRKQSINARCVTEQASSLRLRKHFDQITLLFQVA